MSREDRVEAALADLSSGLEVTRARAAQTLHRLEHPHALEACLATINDAPDELHLDMTPSVRCLREIGEPALPRLFDLMESDDRMTRVRAERAVQWITKGSFGFDGWGWPEGALDRWSAWWTEIRCDADAGDADRHAAVERLRAWLAARSERQ